MKISSKLQAIKQWYGYGNNKRLNDERKKKFQEYE